MKHIKTGNERGQFDLLVRTRQAQAAKMTLQPGGKSDDELSNEHPRCEQWLFVVSGTGTTIAKKPGKAIRWLKLQANSLLVIERGELHQIVNTGRKPLVTINVYVPPAYHESGEPLSSAQE